ncbi:metallophosphoesterase, partial [Salmonella sp. SAL4455]|uniref:metallophosphoesterase n=1 Tax=Salmonella sp. SAL4455 TaxID=3159910 RepID=UPI00397B2B0C
LFLYARFIEPYWIDTTFTTINSPKIKKPLRIVLLSDLHAEGDGLLDTLARLLPGLSPNLILLAGDFIDENPGAPEFQKLLQELQKI